MQATVGTPKEGGDGGGGERKQGRWSSVLLSVHLRDVFKFAVPRLSSGRMLRPFINTLTRPRLIVHADEIVFSYPTAVTDGQAKACVRFVLDFRPLLPFLPFVNA